MYDDCCRSRLGFGEPSHRANIRSFDPEFKLALESYRFELVQILSAGPKLEVYRIFSRSLGEPHGLLQPRARYITRTWL